jgi:hypothetical protein
MNKSESLSDFMNLIQDLKGHYRIKKIKIEVEGFQPMIHFHKIYTTGKSPQEKVLFHLLIISKITFRSSMNLIEHVYNQYKHLCSRKKKNTFVISKENWPKMSSTNNTSSLYKNSFNKWKGPIKKEKRLIKK